MKLNILISNLMLAACFMVGLTGCIKDPVQETTSGGDFQVRVQVRSSDSSAMPTAGGLYETCLGTIDVLSFDQDGLFLYRTPALAIDAAYTWFEIVLRKNRSEQTQTLVVLANLRDEIDAFAPVEGLTTMQQLQQGLVFAFAHRADYADPPLAADGEFGQDRLLPMWGMSDPLVLLTDEQDIGTIYMLRSLATVTLTVDLDTTDPAQKDFRIETAVIYNTPTAGLAIPEAGNLTAGTNLLTQQYEITAHTPTLPATTYDKAYYTAPADGTGFVNRIYIGEKKNSPTGTELTDTWLVIGGIYDNSGTETWYRLPFIDIQGNVCDILRNHNYIFTITKVTGPGSPGEETAVDLGVSLEVRPWDPAQIDGMDGLNQLHVSALEAYVNEHNMARIYFSANSEVVSLDAETKAGHKIADLFYGLDENDGYNFHYTWDSAEGRGSGYFDLITDRDKTGVTAGTLTEHKIYLTADSLKREITVNVQIHSNFAAYDYIGAFWRNDQTGERVIALANTAGTPWSATVDYASDAPYKDWIVLAPGKSIDPGLWSDGQPADAEEYQVTDGGPTVSGTGKVFFRIGLTGPNPDPSQPRYGVVTVTIGSTVKTIYVRQGEAADYVMRPDDPATTWSGDRSLAVKFSPYNVTAPGFKTGSLSDYLPLDRKIGDTGGGVFTEYPSQAGALFKWTGESGMERNAYNPVTSGVLSEYFDSGFWDVLGAVHETCPPGYRRPTAGTITEKIDLSFSVPDDNELVQSLFSHPADNPSNNSIANYLYGYYADGFFDRRAITAPTSANAAGLANSAVDVESPTTGYLGGLYYNTTTNASLFFPISGYRMEEYLMYGGRMGSYWTASRATDLSSRERGVILYMAGAQLTSINTSETYLACPVRCVSE